MEGSGADFGANEMERAVKNMSGVCAKILDTCLTISDACNRKSEIDTIKDEILLLREEGDSDGVRARRTALKELLRSGRSGRPTPPSPEGHAASGGEGSGAGVVQAGRNSCRPPGGANDAGECNEFSGDGPVRRRSKGGAGGPGCDSAGDVGRDAAGEEDIVIVD